MSDPRPDKPVKPTPLEHTPTAPSSAAVLAAEGFGTFLLVLGVISTALFASDFGVAENGTSLGVGFLGVSLAVGLTVVAGAYAFGPISGGHFNPAVTVGAAVGGRFPWKQVPAYVITQVVAAIVAAFVLFVVFQGIPGFDPKGHMGQNGYGDQAASHIHWWAAFLVELVITAVFVLVILGVTDARNEHPAIAPLAIGLALAAIHFMVIPLTGTSANPARSIGPALFAGVDHIVQLWLFILAPLAGGVIGGLVYPVLFGHRRGGSGLRRPGRLPGAVEPGGRGDRRAGRHLSRGDDHPDAERDRRPDRRPAADHPGRLGVGLRRPAVEAAAGATGGRHPGLSARPTSCPGPGQRSSRSTSPVTASMRLTRPVPRR